MSLKQCKGVTRRNMTQCKNTQIWDYCSIHMPVDYVRPVYQGPPAEPVVDPRYQKGKIYLMYHKDEPHVRYIGSTMFSLECRLKSHECASKSIGSGKKKNAHFNHYGWRGVVIELISDAPCNNRTELELIEQHYIRNLKPELNHTWNCD